MSVYVYRLGFESDDLAHFVVGVRVGFVAAENVQVSKPQAGGLFANVDQKLDQCLLVIEITVCGWRCVFGDQCIHVNYQAPVNLLCSCGPMPNSYRCIQQSIVQYELIASKSRAGLHKKRTIGGPFLLCCLDR